MKRFPAGGVARCAGGLARFLARWLLSTVVAAAMAGVLLPIGLLQAMPCCAGRGEEAGEASRELTEEDVATFRAAWERVATAAQVSLDELDRTRVDLSALQQSLGRDPAALFKWVRETTRWVPYAGALKGARGVLLARQGNTLDRALLLARLLELAGHPVRIANGMTNERKRPELEMAARASMSGPSLFDAKQPAVGAAEGEGVAAAAEVLGMSVEALAAETARAREARAELARDVAATTDRQLEGLRGLLQGETLPLKAPEAGSSDPVAMALTQHFWVQVMTGENTWKDYDLFFETGILPGLVVIKGAPFAAEEVPEDLLHKVKLRVVTVAEDKGGRREERVPLEHEMASAHAGVGEFVVSLVPLDAPPVAERVATALGADGAASAAAQLGARKAWVPVVRFPGEADPVSQSGFNAGGDLIPSPLAPGQTVAARVKAGTSLLETLGTELPVATVGNRLVEVRAEFITVGPGVPEVVEVRPVYRSAIAGRAPTADEEPAEALGRAAGLEWSMQVLVQSGVLPGEWAELLRCERLLAVNLALRYLLAPAGTGEEETVATKVAKVVEKTDLFAPGLAALAAARSADSSATGRFLERPNILGLVRALARDGETFVQRDIIDIVSNQGVSAAEGGASDAFWKAMRAGVADSVLETRLRARQSGEAGLSTSGAFGESSDAWTLVKSADVPAWRDWKAPSGEARAAVAADLAMGYWVILKPAAAGDRGATAWWRIDPRRGTTLGMVAQRGMVGGAEMTEYQIMLRVVIRGAVALGSIYGCYQAGVASTGTLLCAVCALAGYLMLGAEIWIFAGSAGSAIASDAISAACAALAIGTVALGSGD